MFALAIFPRVCLVLLPNGLPVSVCGVVRRWHILVGSAELLLHLKFGVFVALAKGLVQVVCGLVGGDV